MLATQNGRSKPSRISWSLWLKLMTPPEMRGRMIAEGRPLAKRTGSRGIPLNAWLGRNSESPRSELSRMLAGLVDGRARVPEPEIADVTILAAVWGYEEDVVKKELAQTSSPRPVNLRASAVGAIVRLREGKHGTVLFLAWSRRLYTTGDKNVKTLAG